MKRRALYKDLKYQVPVAGGPFLGEEKHRLSRGQYFCETSVQAAWNRVS